MRATATSAPNLLAPAWVGSDIFLEAPQYQTDRSVNLLAPAWVGSDIFLEAPQYQTDRSVHQVGMLPELRRRSRGYLRSEPYELGRYGDCRNGLIDRSSASKQRQWLPAPPAGPYIPSLSQQWSPFTKSLYPIEVPFTTAFINFISLRLIFLKLSSSTLHVE
jgi:hypothetical protein